MLIDCQKYMYQSDTVLHDRLGLIIKLCIYFVQKIREITDDDNKHMAETSDSVSENKENGALTCTFLSLNINAQTM